MSPENPAAAVGVTKVDEEVTGLITSHYYPTPIGLDLNVSTLFHIARPSGTDSITHVEIVGWRLLGPGLAILKRLEALPKFLISPLQFIHTLRSHLTWQRSRLLQLRVEAAVDRLGSFVRAKE